MDYRWLLQKYIRHVVDCEGTDFLSTVWYPECFFTEEELTELHRVVVE